MNTMLQANLFKITARAKEGYDNAEAGRARESDVLFDLQARRVQKPGIEIEKAILLQLERLGGAEKAVHLAQQRVLKAEKDVDQAKIKYGLI